MEDGDELKRLQKLHDAVYDQARVWFQSLKIHFHNQILQHFGPMPEREADIQVNLQSSLSFPCKPAPFCPYKCTLYSHRLALVQFVILPMINSTQAFSHLQETMSDIVHCVKLHHHDPVAFWAQPVFITDSSASEA